MNKSKSSSAQKGPFLLQADWDLVLQSSESETPHIGGSRKRLNYIAQIGLRAKLLTPDHGSHG
jgi:hypothetical protein